MGNVPGSEGQDTRCYMCGESLIERRGFDLVAYEVKDGKCPTCGAQVHVVGAPPPMVVGPPFQEETR